MSVAAIRRVPYVTAALFIAVVIVLWAVTYGPTGATAGVKYSPSLRAAVPTARLAAVDAAPYTASVTSKRAAAVAAQRRGTVSTAPMTQPRTMRRSRVVTARTTAPASSELTRARAILAAQVRKHPILRGTTVEFGDARGYQAICYYRSARIIISKRHSASLDSIIGHEVWHVIDWRDNGRIDWGERIPPR